MSVNKELDPEIFFSNLKKIAYMLSFKNEIIPNAIDVSSDSSSFDRMIILHREEGEFRLFVRCINSGGEVFAEDMADFAQKIEIEGVDRGLIISLSDYSKDAIEVAAQNDIQILHGVIKVESNFSHRNQICFYWEGESMESESRIYGQHWSRFAKALLEVKVPVLVHL